MPFHMSTNTALCRCLPLIWDCLRTRSQSMIASARLRLGVKLFAKRGLGNLFLEFGFCSFFLATMTGTEDLVTR